MLDGGSVHKQSVIVICLKAIEEKDTAPVRAGEEFDLAALQLPSEQEYVAAYCARTGRAGIPDLDGYLAFCLFRLAAIFHGIRSRVVRGTAVSDKGREYAKHVEALANLGWQHAQRAERVARGS